MGSAEVPQWPQLSDVRFCFRWPNLPTAHGTTLRFGYFLFSSLYTLRITSIAPAWPTPRLEWPAILASAIAYLEWERFVIGSPIAGLILGRSFFAISGWRWLFVLEGLPAILLGVVACFYLTDFPRGAKWLAPEQSEWLENKLKDEKAAITQTIPIAQALRSRTILLLATVCFLNYFGYYSFLFSLPTMLKRLSGYSDANVGLLGALPYAALFAAMLFNGWHSDKDRERRWHCTVPCLIAATGLSGLAMHPSSIPFLIVLITLVTVGNAYLPALWAMPTEFLNKSAAAAAVGMINAVGSIAGFAGPYLFGYINTKSGSFTYGLAMLAATTIAGGLLVLAVPNRAQTRPVSGTLEFQVRTGVLGSVE